MIHIQVNPDDIPQDWLAKARQLTADLQTCADDPPGTTNAKTAKEKRKVLIDRNQDHWRQLKEILMRWSHQKCWYSELRDDGSDYHVDHFRPKGRVMNPGEQEREGYWWLAFDWQNYRMSVAWCNSPHKGENGEAKGKHDQFPLSATSTFATCPTDNLAAEEVVLLDPVDANDVKLIDFDETGLPTPIAGGRTAERVTTTVRVLHLDAPRMKEARQRVWRECNGRLGKAHKLINQPADSRGPVGDELLKEILDDLRDLLRPTAELSAVARACVRRSTYTWAPKFFPL